MKHLMQESQYGAPVGNYLAEFLVAEERKPLAGSNFGPGLEFKFKIVEGPYAGRIISRTTALKPTLKNSCGRMLTQLAGGSVSAGTELDDRGFVGRRYQVMVEPNFTGNGTRVGTVMPVMPPSGRSAAAPAVPGPATLLSPPLPLRQSADPVLHPAAKFWAVLGEDDDPILADARTIQDFIATNHLEPGDFLVHPEHGSAWEPADKHGFRATVPW
jgi:hypothetical protein